MLRAPGQASRYKTLPYAALAQTIRMETLSEEMRILYVAHTRAQDALIITVPVKRLDRELKTPPCAPMPGPPGPRCCRASSPGRAGC